MKWQRVNLMLLAVSSAMSQQRGRLAGAECRACSRSVVPLGVLVNASGGSTFSRPARNARATSRAQPALSGSFALGSLM
jgi:hypothetical protein